MFVHQKKNPQKPQAKFKKTRKEMQITLENKKKITTKSQSVIKRKNKVEEGGASESGVKKKTGEHKSTIIEDDEGENGTIYNANIGTCK